MKKRICSLLAVAVLLLVLPMQVFAHDYVQMDKEGSIKLELSYGGEPIKDGSFACIKVADVLSSDGNFYFEDLLNPGTVYSEKLPDASDMYTQYVNNSAVFKDYKVTVKNTTGAVTFSSLTPGLYLIIQETSAKGFNNLAPFLVTVPYMDVDGQYKYDVDATVKPELEREPDPTVPTTEPPAKLPQTGQLNWPVPVLAVGGMFLLILGWWFAFGPGKDSYDA